MSELVLTEEQELLRRTAADFVRQSSPVSRVRALRDADDPIGYSSELWREMAALGWPGIVVPEEYGGLGLGFADLVVVLEELGTALAPEPFLSTVVLGAGALLEGGSEERRRELLPRIVAGEEIVALAHHEPGARHRPYRVETRLEPAGGGGYVLRGEKDLVLDGPSASRIVVSARSAGERDDRAGIDLFLVDPSAPGVARTRQHLVDSRAASRIALDGVAVGEADRIGASGRGADVLDAIVDRACVALAAEMLGGMREAFERTLAYLKEREQFGVKIGSFQALKHRAARLFVAIELGRSVVMAAARALDEGSSEAPKLASLAKAQLSDAFVAVANEAIQMHGGIGMTDEHDIGLFLKRARAAEILFGDAAFHRDRYAALEGY